jgi:hypothetical protein
MKGVRFFLLNSTDGESMADFSVNHRYSLRLDRTAISISDDFEEPETTRWWHAQTAELRLQHMMALRAMNYGDRASARLQRVLEIAELPSR